MACDLLIKGGRVLDPSAGLDGPLDIAITGSRIVALEPDIPSNQAARTLEVRGADRRIVPGDKAIVTVHTIRAGQLISPDLGPHTWGWLPEAA